MPNVLFKTRCLFLTAGWQLCFLKNRKQIIKLVRWSWEVRQLWEEDGWMYRIDERILQCDLLHFRLAAPAVLAVGGTLIRTEWKLWRKEREMSFTSHYTAGQENCPLNWICARQVEPESRLLQNPHKICLELNTTAGEIMQIFIASYEQIAFKIMG